MLRWEIQLRRRPPGHPPPTTEFRGHYIFLSSHWSPASILSSSASRAGHEVWGWEETESREAGDIPHPGLGDSGLQPRVVSEVTWGLCPSQDRGWAGPRPPERTGAWRSQPPVPWPGLHDELLLQDCPPYPRSRRGKHTTCTTNQAAREMRLKIN